MDRKKKIINQNQSVINNLQRLSNEVKGSVDFVLKKYEFLNFNVISNKLPELNTLLNKIQEDIDLEITDNAGEAIEAQKKTLDPRNIGKFYMDMIFNIFNK